MRARRWAALLVTSPLAILGFFFIWAGASGGFLSLPFPSVSGILLLILAAVTSALSLGANENPSGALPSVPPVRSGISWVSFVAGAFVALIGPFLPFPIGCNVGPCYADPEGTWSTIWPNVAIVALGLTLFAWGLVDWRTRGALSSVGLSIGLTLSGALLFALGNSITYVTFGCQAGGCTPLTASQWWSLFWPDVIAESIGLVLVTAGLAKTALTLRSVSTAVRLQAGAASGPDGVRTQKPESVEVA